MNRVSLASVALCLCLSACYRAATPSVVSPPAGFAPMVHRHAAHGYKTVFAFDGKHGSSPNGPLLVVKGQLYGTTTLGGDWSAYGGTVFAMSSAGKEKVLHSFGKGADGKGPTGGLILLNGMLFGVTAGGGKYGGGTVFSMTPSGSEHVLHSFGKGKDGKIPGGGLAELNGVLYGTTTAGGKHYDGVLFSVTTAGDYSDLYSFPRGYGDTGHGSVTPLKGMLYGTRSGGGCENGGMAFSASTAGNVNIIYYFGGVHCSNYGDALNPDGALVAVKNTLYGTAFGGGAPYQSNGAVYSLTPSGEEHVVYAFGAKGDGTWPECVLLPVKGALYGVTSEGGANGNGTVFSVAPSGTEQVLYSFGQEPDGANPEGGLVNVKGVLYGTTPNGGGNPYGVGTVFSILP